MTSWPRRAGHSEGGSPWPGTACGSLFLLGQPQNLDEAGQLGRLGHVFHLVVDGDQVLDHADEDGAGRRLLQIPLVEAVAGLVQEPRAVLLGQKRPAVEAVHENAVAVGLVLHEERSEEHTSELQSLAYLVCRLLLEKKKKKREHKCSTITS